MTGFGHILDSKFHVFLEKFFQGAKAALPCNFVAVSGTESLFLSQTISKKYTGEFFPRLFYCKVQLDISRRPEECPESFNQQRLHSVTIRAKQPI